MRRHAKRSASAMIAVLAALAAIFLLSASALGAAPQLKPELGFGCSPATPCGEIGGDPVESWNPERLAVNEQSGDVYVLDASANDAIQIFAADGTYKDHILGSSTTAGSFGYSAQYDDIAIDNSGAATQGRVYLVSGTAKFLGFDAPTAAVPHAFLWEQGPAAGAPCGIAVDGAGRVFGAEYFGGIFERNSGTGATQGASIVPAAEICFIAFDLQGDLFANNLEGPVNELLAPGYAAPGTPISPGSVRDVEVNRDLDRAYAIRDSADLRVIGPGGSEEPGSPVNSGEGSYAGVAANSKTGRVYVANPGSGKIEVWDPAPVEQTIFTYGSGSGEVSCDAGAGPEACAPTYPDGTVITVTATPDAGSTFAGFAGSAGSAGVCTTSPCTYRLTAETEGLARFSAIQRSLTIAKAGSGAGTVTCDGAPCASKYPQGRSITLKATPAAGSEFDGWSGGGCTGTGVCQLTIAADTTVTASFTAIAPDSGGGGGGGAAPAPPVLSTGTDGALRQCIARADKAARKARKAARAKQGKARDRAVRKANKRRAKAIAACREG